MKCWSISILVLLLTFAGCDSPNEFESPDPDMNQDSSDPRTLDSDERIIYVQDTEDRLDDFDRRMAELLNRIEAAGEELEEGLDRSLAELDQKRREAGRKFEDVQAASVEAWRELRTDLDVVVDELERAYARIRLRVDDTSE